MRRETPFTLEEAKAYLIESIKEWENTNQTDKIISLAGMAYNRRNKSETVNDKLMIRELQKNINSLTACIKRNEHIQPKFDNSSLKASLKAAQQLHDGLVGKLNALAELKMTKK